MLFVDFSSVPPMKHEENFTPWALVPHSAVGFWISAQADLRYWQFHLLDVRAGGAGEQVVLTENFSVTIITTPG